MKIKQAASTYNLQSEIEKLVPGLERFMPMEEALRAILAELKRLRAELEKALNE